MAQVHIPGSLIAHVEFGRVRFVFTPAASDAGYTGPAAVAVSGDLDSIQVEDVGGPFWRMVQAALAEGSPIDWRE